MMPSGIGFSGFSFHSESSDRTNNNHTTVTTAPSTIITAAELTSTVKKLTQARNQHSIPLRNGSSRAQIDQDFPKSLYLTGVGMPQFYKGDMAPGELAQWRWLLMGLVWPLKKLTYDTEK